MKPPLLWMAAAVVALGATAGPGLHANIATQSLPPERLTDDIDGFVARSATANGQVMRYRLFVPEHLDPARRYPLVIWLHGAGGIGTENYRQISDDQLLGTHTWTELANQEKHPAFVLAPQSSLGWLAQPESRRADSLRQPLTAVLAVLDSVTRQYPVDEKRIYVAGQSDGGYGVWDLITNRPDRFAAAIILCGGGTPARAARLASMPVWVFHGSNDLMVPVSEARDMVRALQRAGGKPKYTEYKGLGHEIWSRAFNEPDLVEWLYAQHKP